MGIGTDEKVGMILFLQPGCISADEVIEIIQDKRVRNIIVEGTLLTLRRIGLFEFCECKKHKNEKRYLLTQKGVDSFGVYFAKGLFFPSNHLSKKGKVFKEHLMNCLGDWFFSTSCKESCDSVSGFKLLGKYASHD